MTAVAGWLVSAPGPADVEQCSLFDVEEAPEPASLDARFAAFHANHPGVFTALHNLSLDLLAQGHSRLSIGMLYEVVRWQTLLGDPEAAYRLNNSYRSRYSRLLAESDPRLADAFETRELKS